MTWRKKLEQLITKSEFLFLETPVKASELLAEEYAQELTAYLGLKELELSKEEQGWTLTLFLHLLAGYSKGERITQSGILSQMSSGLGDLCHIETAINTLEVRQIILKKLQRNRSAQDVILEVIPTTMDKVLHKIPLPKLEYEEILSKKLLILLKDQQVPLSAFYLKESQEMIDLFLQSHQPRFLKKLNRYTSIKGTAWYLMVLLIARYYADGGLSKDMSKASITLKVNSDPFTISLVQGKTRLQALKFVETDHYEFIKELWVSLTPQAMDKLCLVKNGNKLREKTGGSADLEPLNTEDDELNFFQLVKNEQIESEELFYNEHLQYEMDFYTSLLTKEDAIFKKNKAIKGRIILMFDGLPGTGKTAAAQQLARQTGRDIVHVNWQTFRGQWVGQSEKNLKDMLEQVDTIAIKSKRVPVVLFNEAEAFLSQRIAITQSTDRMENNLVSLLLEWLEKKAPFCIVIFTSNHRQLMDKAFERRISHITFDAPDEATRAKIWDALSGEIDMSADACAELAQYPLTGAEIARVLNTYSLHQIAYEIRNPNLALLRRLCADQKWLESDQKIGFKTRE